MSDTAYPLQSPLATASEFNTLTFLIQQLLSKLATAMLVKVMKVTNTGGVSPVGFVDVQPMVNQLTGNQQAVTPGTIFNIPYFRVQGGANAIILDPQVNDIGVAVFCSRDISAVKSTKQVSNPGSLRTFDWADGLYFGGFLNGTPTQYFAFSETGITVVSPTKITLQAPQIVIEASTSITINSPANTIEGGATSIDGKPFLPHAHSGVQSGSSDSGPVV